MRRILAVAAGLAWLSLAVQADAATATVTRAWQYKDTQQAALRLENLIGNLRVERGEGAGFRVSVSVTTEADDPRQAQALADAVGFRTQDAGSASSFEVVLPDDRFPVIYHPGTAEGWFGRAYVQYLGERRRITGDADKGVHVRVDILVSAPVGATLKARNLLGDAVAEGVNGELRLDGTSGRLTSRNGSGKVELDSGSGPVEVVAHTGEVHIDTGSGQATVRDSHAHIVSDTGSGDVSVIGGDGDVDADTGSGSVSIAGFSGSVHADTGSGSVQVTDSRGARELVADTGSGSVSISGDLSALTRLKLETGSGAVTVTASAWPSMAIVVDTASGGKHIDVPGAQVSVDSHDRTVVSIGSAAASGMIDTGSGSVRLAAMPPGQ